jgi:dihydroorotate dehydrogenase electron transfer subunit
MQMNSPYITTVLNTTKETEDITTISFRYPGSMIPGQFFMVWIPGVDEVPMSVSSITPTVKTFTVRAVGEATHRLSQMQKGEKIGIRGPYGNGFTIKGKHLLFVGGGSGIAMLAPAVEKAQEKKVEATVVIGAKTKRQVFFEDRFRQSGATVVISTDDGSAGVKGFASEVACELVKKGKIDAVYTCGPELMMKQLLSCCSTVFFQASLERFMKCAIGLCGQCCIGNGMRVCIDGPIFDGTLLKNIPDFGLYHRDPAGRKILF